MAAAQFKDLKLHSPSGAEPFVYPWPLSSGPDKHDSGSELIDTIRWVCDDMPEIKSALEDIVLNDIDTNSYEIMKWLCDKYNRAIDSVAALVSFMWHLF